MRTIKEAMRVADGDLKALTGLLDLRLIAGDEALATELRARANEQWRKQAKRWLPLLRESGAERHARFGEVAYLLEPELKEGRGGLRDAHALRLVERACPVVTADRVAALAEPERRLRRIRAALHERAGRRLDRLVLQEQDGVAADLGYADADELMADVSASARTITYVAEDVWDRVVAWQGGPVARSERVILGHDPGDLLAAAVEAAETGVPISPTALATLASEPAPPLPDRWPEAWRHDLVALLATGHAAIPVLEALDQHGLLTRLLPEWEWVRHKPQRNAYHRYTVDRHLWECAAQAAARTREVARPDLLLVGALLHDIGKGWPGDHTEVGIEVVGELAPRLGFDDADVRTLQELVRLHLLLADAATRRDLGDPTTIDRVAAEVGDTRTLELLVALTEADSLATGPSAWSDWKAGLVKELADKTFVQLFTGARAGTRPGRPDRVVLEAPPGVEHGLVGEGNRCTIVGIDRPGLFSKVAGVLALHGLDVRSATVGSAADGRAVEVIDVEPAFDRQPRWDRVAADLDAVLDGRLSLDRKLADRARSYARRYRITSATPADPRVLVDNSASRRATVVEVRAPDGVAVLYRITSALFDAGLDVRVARISTIGHEVVDAFYVVGPDRRKLTDPAQLAAVEAAVLAAVGSGG